MLKRFLAAIFINIVGVLMASGAEPADAPIKTYNIHRATAPLTIDGKFDEADWASAEVGQLGDPRDGKPPRLETSFRMLYDDQRLYVAFQVVDPHIFSPAVKHDDPVFDGDCVELFLCTGADPSFYYEIDMSPVEIVWDALIVNTRGWDSIGGEDMLNKTPLKEYDCKGLEIKVRVNGGSVNKTADGKETAESWDVEVSLPFSQLPGKNSPPKKGDEWRGNIYRIERPGDGKVELQAFSPTISLHFARPGRFAFLRFQ